MLPPSYSVQLPSIDPCWCPPLSLSLVFLRWTELRFFALLMLECSEFPGLSSSENNYLFSVERSCQSLTSPVSGVFDSETSPLSIEIELNSLDWVDELSDRTAKEYEGLAIGENATGRVHAGLELRRQSTPAISLNAVQLRKSALQKPHKACSKNT